MSRRQNSHTDGVPWDVVVILTHTAEGVMLRWTVGSAEGCICAPTEAEAWSIFGQRLRNS